MNLGDLELMIYDRLGASANPDEGLKRRYRREINVVHKRVLGMRNFSELRRAVLTAASVASSPYMVLPQAAVAIITIQDRANNRNLMPISLEDIRYRDPGLTFASSVPDSYALLSWAAAVAKQPSAADSIFVISTSAADGSGISATIEGIVTGGYYRRATVALNGVTGANLSSSISTWEHISKFYLSGAASGTVTLRQTSGAGTELANIQPGASITRYTLLHLSGTPSSAQTYYCDVERHVEDMTSIYDEPLLPEDFHSVIADKVCAQEWLKREKTGLWKVAMADYTNGLSEMGAHLRRRGGVSVSGQRSNQRSQFSQLGSQYPAGS